METPHETKHPETDQEPPRPLALPRTIPALLGFTFRRIVAKRKWLLLPLWVLLVSLALVVMFTGHPNLLPVIYLAF